MDEKMKAMALDEKDLEQVTGGSCEDNGFMMNVLCSVCQKPMSVPMSEYAKKDFVCNKCRAQDAGRVGMGKITDAGSTPKMFA